MHKKAFTLLEILIVIVLFGLLAGIILQTYTTISQIGFRIQQEKEISKEALVLSQVLENLAQTSTIDYDRYQQESISRETLKENKGIVETLYLKDNSGNSFSLKSECSNEQAPTQSELLQYENLSTEVYNDTSNQALIEKIKNSDCKLVMEQQSETITLLDSKDFKLTQVRFKIIPTIGIAQLRKAYQEGNEDSAQLPESGQPGFWLLATLYSKYYQPQKRSNNIALPLQLFYSLQGNLPSLYSTSSDTNETS